MQTALERRQAIAAVMFFVALTLLPLVVGDFYLTVLSLIFLWACVGIAWNLMMGFAGQLSLGHALYFGVGAYIMAILTERYGVSPWLALIPTAAVPAVLGIIVGALGFRFTVRGVYFALLTIAFAELARILFEHWEYVGKTGGFFLKALTAQNEPLKSLRGGAMFFYYALLITMLLSWIISIVLVRSHIGYCWRAIREDEDASRALGVQAFRLKLLAVAISAALTGIAGSWFALINGSLFPELGARHANEHQHDRGADHRRARHVDWTYRGSLPDRPHQRDLSRSGAVVQYQRTQFVYLWRAADVRHQACATRVLALDRASPWTC